MPNSIVYMRCLCMRRSAPEIKRKRGSVAMWDHAMNMGKIMPKIKGCLHYTRACCNGLQNVEFRGYCKVVRIQTKNSIIKGA